MPFPRKLSCANRYGIGGGLFPQRGKATLNDSRVLQAFFRGASIGPTTKLGECVWLLFCQMSSVFVKRLLSPVFLSRAAHGSLIEVAAKEIPGANKRGWSRCTRGFKATWFKDASAKN